MFCLYLQIIGIYLQNEYGLCPDMIFFTGDAIYGHLSNDKGKNMTDQFVEADNFFPGKTSQESAVQVHG